MVIPPFPVPHTDRMKADDSIFFLYLLPIISIFWQLGHGSAITPIEATAMAYAIVAVIAYGLWFKKPLDVNTSHILDFDVIIAD